jgi:hypothetical protein
MGPPHFISIHQLQPELHDARQVALSVDDAELRVAETGVRWSEALGVGDVERLGAELEVPALGSACSW